MNFLQTILFSLVIQPQLLLQNHLPINKDKAVVEVVDGIVYAYNSEPGQTDNDPFITASGSRTRHGIIANNCLKFGTVVTINEKSYEVLDRMNSRYGCNVFDIWMKEKQQALNWGKKFEKILILKKNR